MDPHHTVELRVLCLKIQQLAIVRRCRRIFLINLLDNKGLGAEQVTGLLVADGIRCPQKFFQVLGLPLRHEFFRVGVQIGLNQGHRNCFSLLPEIDKHLIGDQRRDENQQNGHGPHGDDGSQPPFSIGIRHFKDRKIGQDNPESAPANTRILSPLNEFGAVARALPRLSQGQARSQDS